MIKADTVINMCPAPLIDFAACYGESHSLFLFFHTESVSQFFFPSYPNETGRWVIGAKLAVGALIDSDLSEAN